MEEILRDKKDKTLLTTIGLAIALSVDEGKGRCQLEASCRRIDAD
jgi:hypothetical protein